MKKFKSLFICAALSACILTSSSCTFISSFTSGSKENPEIKADYTEVTVENQAEVMSFLEEKVSANSVFGNTEAAEWKKGASLVFSVDYKDRYEKDYTTLKADGNVKIALSKATETDTDSVFGLKAQALASVAFQYDTRFTSTNTESSEAQKNSVDLSANLFVDNTMTYGDYTFSNVSNSEQTSQSAGMKIATETLLEQLVDMFNSMGESEDSSSDVALTSSEISSDSASDSTPNETNESMVSVLGEYGLKAYYELSEETGLVLKISASKATIDKAIEETGATFDSFQCVSTPTFNFYLAIDNTGALKKLALDINVAATYKVDSKTATLSLKTLLVLELSDSVEVKLPDGLESDSKYKEISGGSDLDETQPA